MSRIKQLMPEFDSEKLNISEWLDLFNMSADINGVTADGTKKSFLLSSIGVDTYSTVCKLAAPRKASEMTFDELVNLLKDHFMAAPSYHRCLCDFMTRKKGRNENVKEYYAELKKLAQRCDFDASFDQRLKEQLLVGVNGEIYFKILLADTFDFKQITSSDLLNKMSTLETAYVTESNDNGNSNVNKVKQSNWKNKQHKNKNDGNCRRCGKTGHSSDDCRFKNCECNTCGKRGHISKVCRSKDFPKPKQGEKFSKFKSQGKVNNVNDAEGGFTESFDLLKIFDESSSINSIKPFVQDLHLGPQNLPVEFELDSGSGVSTLNKSIVRKLKLKDKPSTKMLFNYDGKRIESIGEVCVDLKYQGTDYGKHSFHIVDDDHVNLAGRDLFKKLNFKILQSTSSNVIKDNPMNEDDMGKDHLTDSQCTSTNLMYGNSKTEIDRSNTDASCVNKNNALSNYKTDIKKPVVDFKAKIELKDNAKAKYFKPRPVPFHYKKGIESALNDMILNDVIEPINHSDWAMPIVPVVKSNGSIRICVDFKYLNANINMEQYPVPLLDEILSEFSDCKYFTKLDLKNAYLQLEVHEESQKYLVMSTHIGMFKYKRLPYGISSAPGIFQRFINELLMGLPKVRGYFDDILIGGSTQNELNINVRKVLSILQSRNVSLNESKCIFNQKEVPYLGFVLSADGIKPDKSKILAITNASRPTDVNNLRSFLGLCVHYSRFIRNCSSILTPLYDLTQSNVEFKWNNVHEQAFQNIKHELANAGILDTFKYDSTLILEVDASKIGIGAVLKQLYDDKTTTVSFASKKLSSAELNYSQIDKEALAIVYGVKKFQNYLTGKKFILKSDHKPLIHIFNPDKNIPVYSNARIQRWALFLSAFNFEIKHISGKNNVVSDALR